MPGVEMHTPRSSDSGTLFCCKNFVASFPHREIGQVLHSMLDHAPIDEAVKKQAYEQIFEAVGALDISEL